MTVGVGGSTAEQELAGLSRQTDYVSISPDERQKRLAKAQRLMVEQGMTFKDAHERAMVKVGR